MKTASLSPPIRSVWADLALTYSVNSWVAIAMIGQWLFATYILIVYAYPVTTGQFEQVNLAKPITGYVNGDTFGNGMLFAHVIPAAILSICGVFQLIPWIRKHHPKWHRYNGRLFLALGLVGAASGLYLTWVRGSRLSDIGALGVTLNGLLILVFAASAWYFAIKGRIALHKRLAVHAFLLINGVWFFRLYIMAWFIANQGPNGNTATMDGPFDVFLSFACYGIPMLIAELVWWAQRNKSHSKKWSITLVVSLGALVTLGGVIAATLFMWLPKLEAILA